MAMDMSKMGVSAVCKDGMSKGKHKPGKKQAGKKPNNLMDYKFGSGKKK